MAMRTRIAASSRKSVRGAVKSELSTERILDAAQALIDREGDGALTFRRLGAELDVDPTAAYRHFRNKDDLLLALGDRLYGEAINATFDQLPPDPDWRTLFCVNAHALRDCLLKHPKLAMVISVRVTQGQHEAQAIERSLAVLSQTGLPTRELVGLQRAFADTLLAWCAFSATYAALPEDARARDEAAWATTYRRLPADDFPHIRAAGPYLDDFDDAFDLAINLFLDGIQARIDRYTAHKSAHTTAQENP